MTRGEIVELEIERFADRGKSLARHNGKVVMVAGGVPGDRVRARITKPHRKHAEARVVELLHAGPERTTPRCRYFGTCGGCAWQHVAYGAQCEAKRQSVIGALAHTGGFPDPPVAPTLGSEREYGYRNKMEFSFSSRRWLLPEEIATGERLDDAFALGLHVPGDYVKVLDTTECHLQSTLSVRIVNTVRDWTRNAQLAPWDVAAQDGFLRHLVIRHGEHTGETMVNLITAHHDLDVMAALGLHLQEHLPEITTFVNGISNAVSLVAFGDPTHVIYGPGVIHDRIGNHTFEIAPNAFFQTNTRQAERLYEVTRRFADLRPDDLVYDLYCGTGTISLFVADAVRHVVGVELIESAVEGARSSALANGVHNTTFVCGDLMRLFTPDFVRQHGRPDVLITDPPRAGMHPKVVEQIAQLQPERLVYVSCNPQTQARDLALLGGRYRLEAVQPVDMFPHTYHIESVASLRRIADA